MVFKKLSLIFLAATSVYATQSMHRPDNYKSAPKQSPTEPNFRPQTITRRATNGKTNFAYFTNWGIYGADFQPTEIPTDTVTHLLYSFADASADTGAVKLTDSYADVEKHYDGDSWDETGNNVYGCIKQLYLIKLAHRNIKTLLSIGGWTYSQAGHFAFVTDATKRATFVADAITMIEDNGFDGIDIDFEYPGTAEEGQGFADLVAELRTALDDLQKSKSDENPYLISVAVSAGSSNYANLVIPKMDEAIDFWNLMAYDYAGSWSNFTDNQANVYGGAISGVSTDSAIKYYTESGATIGKINMGMPLYGRAFEETDGIGSTFNGIGEGTVEAGIYSYNVLPIDGAEVFENTTDISSYSYDSAKKELVSYDTPNIIKLKTQYVNDNALAGAMFWELSTDRTGDDSLVKTAATELGALDTTENHISYPNSQYDNLKANFGQ
ncbi:glycoside hydrolase family 18 protein [Cylindrobasidium torrendii FP15055 ss-10]|uniref:chitinase n=1 Tax=Cylindrobasidium torrendii FP15055 ss-10 TaxID=1314674 RepID=A0A0D7B6E3_9AGAR|nr:glycoside hydrolase family 18 protein [Cylindrobasidium torrendii FP15055 ss-10]